jgi:hypothetical protein
MMEMTENVGAITYDPARHNPTLVQIQTRHYAVDYEAQYLELMHRFKTANTGPSGWNKSLREEVSATAKRKLVQLEGEHGCNLEPRKIR